jgi:hypothetical protein
LHENREHARFQANAEPHAAFSVTLRLSIAANASSEWPLRAEIFGMSALTGIMPRRMQRWM